MFIVIITESLLDSEFLKVTILELSLP